MGLNESGERNSASLLFATAPRLSRERRLKAPGGDAISFSGRPPAVQSRVSFLRASSTFLAAAAKGSCQSRASTSCRKAELL
jgi:hypothetical protein